MREHLKYLFSDRRTAVVITLLMVVLAAEFLVTRHVISSDRADIERTFSEDRLEQLVHAIDDVEEELDDTVEDLEFARHLAVEDDPIGQRQRRLAQLLGGVEHYRAAVMVTENGRRIIGLADSDKGAPLSEEANAALFETARTAMEQPSNGLVISAAIEDRTAQAKLSSLRVFALGFSAENQSRGAVALMVDVGALYAPLKLVASDDHTSLVLLGPGGQPETLTDREFAQMLSGEEDSMLEPLLEPMRANERGWRRMPTGKLDPLGLEETGALAAYDSIEVADQPRWQVATLTSLSVLKGRENEVAARLSLVSGVIAVLLVGFGGFFVISSRREAVLSERLQVAREMAHLHEKADKILANIPAGVMLIDEQGRVSDFNQTVSGWLPSAEPDSRLVEIFEQAKRADRRALQQLIERARTNSTTLDAVYEHSTLFGDDRQLRVHVVPLEPAVPDANAVVVFEDFTEVHALESQLLRAEKMATVGILAAGIAHEIGTPLGVVRGRAEYLSMKLEDRDIAQESLGIIIDQIDRVSRVIRGVLDFSRQQPPAVKSVDFEAVIEQVIALMRYELEGAELDVEVDVDDDLPALRADPDNLQQVLVNLLVNAIDASAAGGQIRISARPSERSLGAQAARARIEIRDTGAGIAEERIHQVFDPFYTTKKRGKGTGLGLPIVAKIVQDHGGQIDLESEPGRGTKVIILWPTSTQQETAHERQ
jgi:two-component system, NtrC family, sensor histidine kinase HydH